MNTTPNTATPAQQQILTQTAQANRHAARAYWWIKDIDPQEAQRLGVDVMVKKVLSLLQQVDNITVDIEIRINQLTHKTTLQSEN